MNDNADDSLSLQNIVHKYILSGFNLETLNETCIPYSNYWYGGCVG